MESSYRQNKAALLKMFQQYRLCKYLEEVKGQRKELIEKVESAMERLPEIERKLITLRFLQSGSEYERNYNVCEAMQISSGTFQTIRNRAFYKLIYMFSKDAEQIREDHNNEANNA
ncbi:hypothetical protein AB4Z45_12615 [Paenibacillus sp. MCAF9]|uniref:hypothetical protein n=1 Tax=Paenibacillus sp. MCAF9 TaxID=3233046 RepID=UPI003F96D0A2